MQIVLNYFEITNVTVLIGDSKAARKAAFIAKDCLIYNSRWIKSILSAGGSCFIFMLLHALHDLSLSI